MFVVGVDPGRTGALAIVDTVARRVLDLLDVPELALGTWRLVDGAAVQAWLARQSFDLAVLERVDARPSDGRGSIAQLGRNCGGLAALLTATGRPLLLASPNVWKARAGLIGQPKAASLALARLLFGSEAGDRWFRLQKHDGRAEACLIALHGL
jgi:crossover junction endodeoxyribonuclease RuvC